MDSEEESRSREESGGRPPQPSGSENKPHAAPAHPEENKDGASPEKQGTPLPDGEPGETAGLKTAGGHDFHLNIAGLDAAQKGGQADRPPAEGKAGAAPGGAAEGGKKKKRGCLRGLIHTSLVLSASILLAMALLWSMNEVLALTKPDREIDVKILSRSAISDVAGQLKKSGVIQSGLLFSLYTSLTHSGSVKPGTYTLSTNMSYMQIVRDLRRGAPREVVRVTIPEGYTLQKIGDLLESKDVCPKQDFLSACDSADTKFAFSPQVPASQGRFYRLEGYLFPDTYDFYKDQSAQAAAEKMLGNFDDKFTAAMQQRAKQLHMTVDQVVTLASIIQVESSDVKEMANVSSVFHNRLDKGVDGHHFLQSDATIFYIKRDINTVLSSSDTSIDSPYNTYKHELLPPGPICNPGIAAINAALNPANTGYYFFVTDKNNKYYYSETYSQHVSAVAKALKSGNATGTDVVK